MYRLLYIERVCYRCVRRVVVVFIDQGWLRGVAIQDEHYVYESPRESILGDLRERVLRSRRRRAARGSGCL